MLRQTSRRVSPVAFADLFPWPPEPAKRPRGRPPTSFALLILQALVIMILRRLYTAYILLTLLDQEVAVARPLRPLLDAPGQFPTCHTWNVFVLITVL